MKETRNLRELIRRRREMIKAVSDFIAERCMRTVTDRQSILQALEELKGPPDITVFYVCDEWVSLDLERVKKFIAEASEATISEIVERVNKRVSQMEREAELAKQLEERLNQGAPPGVDSEVIELSHPAKDFWGVKARVGANTYLFDFEGTFEELVQELLHVREEQERDIVTCPFCGAWYIRAFAIRYLRGCPC
ncbi:hypothetical protein KEJ25_04820, partial [Candidatus Bathyarchaeota archaeon]|nr:hypothetical protein [Candidatus Bathyarchaeota archaeon]